jgi:hypothetical protein
MLEDAFIVKTAYVDVPDALTLPDPVNPVHTNRVLVDPGTGDVTVALMSSLAPNHPLVGVGEP